MRAFAVLTLSIVAGGSCGQTCSGGARACPPPSAGIGVAVTTTPAMVVNGVQAELTGPVSGTMLCKPSPYHPSTYCEWPYERDVVAGAYSLQVSAPGYETATIQLEVATPPPGCGCLSDSIQPSTVTLRATDGGSN